MSSRMCELSSHFMHGVAYWRGKIESVAGFQTFFGISKNEISENMITTHVECYCWTVVCQISNPNLFGLHSWYPIERGPTVMHVQEPLQLRVALTLGPMNGVFVRAIPRAGANWALWALDWDCHFLRLYFNVCNFHLGLLPSLEIVHTVILFFVLLWSSRNKEYRLVQLSAVVQETELLLRLAAKIATRGP